MTELWGHVMRAWVAAVQGDEVEREARFALAIDLAESAGLRRAVECNVAEARGQALIARREYELAASTLALLDGLDTAGGASPLARWLPDLAEALLRAGRLDEARERIAQLEKVHADSRQKWAQAAAARLHGLIEDEFEGSFERALELGSTAYKPFELARTALYYGERLRRAGERRRARARLADALATFSRLGARPWASRAEAELRASGQTRAPQRSYGSLLTPSEQQVAALVADGLSNREIAERLFVSVRTVEMHISNAYRKLGIRSRTGLARYVLTDPAPAEHEPISTH
jgi:DNA-binding NarL/FixJ family response regulator